MSEGAGWQFILNPGITGRVLCWDESAGTTVLPLAGICREVSVIHPEPGVLRAIQQALAVNGVTNVACTQAWADGNRLPFPDEHFDGFIMSGVNQASVLQIVTDSQSIESALQALFAEVYRVLKTGGFAYASLQNRFGYDKIAGFFKRGDTAARNEHGNHHVPFASLKRAAGKSGFGFIKSYKLLTSNGAVEEVILGKEYSPTKNSFVLKQRIKKSLLSGPFAERLAPSMGMVCAKGKSLPGYLEELVDDLIRRGVMSKHRDAAFVVERYLILPGKVILSVGVAGRTGGAKIVIFPLTAAVLARLRDEANILKALHEGNLHIRPLVPEYYLEGEVLGQKYLVQQEIPGTSIDAAVSSLDRMTWRALQVLTDFHHETSQEVVLHDDLFRTLFSNPLHRVAQKLGPASAPSLQRIEATLRTELLGKPFRTVWMHGDYKIENLMFDPKRLQVSGIIDWDLSQKVGLPLLDLLYLIAYNRVIREGREMEEIFLDNILPGKLSSFERAARDEYIGKTGMDAGFTDILTVMFWIYHVAFRIEVASGAVSSMENMFRTLSSVEQLLEAKHG
jgi:aminoglycoside phosphotransferase (APT) family kinase protein/SAM-dependent methyltransferase